LQCAQPCIRMHHQSPQNPGNVEIPLVYTFLRGHGREDIFCSPIPREALCRLSSPPESFKRPPVLAFWFMPQALQGSQRPTAVIELCELCSMIDPLASRSVNRRKAWGNTGRGNACATHTVTPPYFHNEDLHYCQRSR
jgi:hypothetical protein